MGRQRAVHVVRDLRQLRALATPIRKEILDALRVLGPSTVREVASHLGWPSESLYYHVRALRAAGLLREAGRRATARRAESVFEPVAADFRLDPRPRSRTWIEETRRVVRLRLRALERGFTRSLGNPRLRRTGKAPQLWMRSLRVRLDRPGLERLLALADEMTELLEGANAEGRGEVYEVLVALHPDERSARGSER